MRGLALMMALGMSAGLGATSALGQAAEEAKTLVLWPDGAPGAVGTTPDDVPTLTVYLPAKNPTRTGVLVAPGGGYQHLATEKEGTDVAHWLNQHGVAAFVLKYRLGPVYHHPIELGDAERAMRMVRANAVEYDIADDHIGMWGFSAGGHLAASTATLADAGDPNSEDPIERQSARPNFLVLAYPVISMLDPYAHRGSRHFLLGDTPSAEDETKLSPELHVTRQTPPTFLFATSDDPVVPVMNSVLFYSALVKAGVPTEMHLFQHGPHGVGLAAGRPEVANIPALAMWPDLLLTWMQARGFAGK